MNTNTLINKRTVSRNFYLKKAQREERIEKGKGSRRPIKNYIGKVVSLSSAKLIGEESGIANFVCDMPKEDLLSALKNTNISGMSGNGFPLYRKTETFLSSDCAEKVLLVNAVECDPALRHDEWLLKNRYAEIEHTLKYLSKIFSLNKVIVAVKNRNLKMNAKFLTVSVPPRYPMGEEHFLIRQALDIELDSKEIPAKRGILVLNLQSVYQIGKIASKCYDGGRFVTVADLTKAATKIAYVYPADTIKCVLEKSFGGENNKSMYKGHGVMAAASAGETDDFSKHENFAAYAEAPKLNNSNRCWHCGNCSRKCPMNIKVSKIVQSLDSAKGGGCSSYRPQDCFHCGSCTYFCPASKNVSGYVSRAADFHSCGRI